MRSPQAWVWFDRNWCNQNGLSEFGHAEYGWVFSKEDARSFFFFQLLGTLFESFYKYSSPKKNKTKPVETFPNLVTNSRRESKNLKCLMFAKKFYILKQISSFQRWATGWFKYMWTFSEHQALKGYQTLSFLRFLQSNLKVSQYKWIFKAIEKSCFKIAHLFLRWTFLPVMVSKNFTNLSWFRVIKKGKISFRRFIHRTSTGDSLYECYRWKYVRVQLCQS